MIEFFRRFILPSSPLRSKFAVHLNAQKPAETQMVGVTIALEKDKNPLSLNENTTDEGNGEMVEIRAQGNGTAPFTITGVREFKSMIMG
ncbi:hypothetical protein BJ878DRAFT_526728 [Calycina marina]|uniref:Uncharacterized protein n=1 Tax=Calycina marina TaxID=1763456 RepID=A0A9P8CB89_9HELO|nr:hypothetical protein BJ878DRAFT_526728 [Calycina marina]